MVEIWDGNGTIPMNNPRGHAQSPDSPVGFGNFGIDITVMNTVCRLYSTSMWTSMLFYLCDENKSWKMVADCICMNCLFLALYELETTKWRPNLGRTSKYHWW